MSSWKLLLERLNALLSESQNQNVALEFFGASEDQLQVHEKRLGTKLPPSYRNFLSTTNGWGAIDRTVWRMLPVAEIGWVRDKKIPLIEGWLQGERQSPPLPAMSDEDYLVYGQEQSPQDFRPEYLETALQISEMGDSAIVLLNPAVTQNGEWEAWYFASWLPGAVRYRSFLELMEDMLDQAREFERV